jgi:hypothetical protein
MTDPSHDLPDDDLDDATVARLRALLRDEPVEDDELARERRLRTAMAAAQAPGVGAPAEDRPSPVPPPRRSGARPWLVAAAVLALVGIGGYFAVSVTGSGGNDESADSAAMQPESSDAARAPEDGTAGADGSPTTTTPDPDSALAEATGAVTDLGTFDDIASLRSALDVAPAAGAAADSVQRSAAPDVMPCVQQELALGIEVVGTAVVGGEPVVVVRTPAGAEILDAATCAPVAG